MRIVLSKAEVVSQLRVYFAAMKSFEGYLRNEMEIFLNSDGYRNVDATVQNMRYNQHVRELYRGKIVAVLEMIGEYDEVKGDTSDTDHLESIIIRLQNDVDSE